MMVMSLYGELEARLGGKETTREECLGFQSSGKACGWCRRGTTSGDGVMGTAASAVRWQRLHPEVALSEVLLSFNSTDPSRRLLFLLPSPGQVW